MTALPGPPPSLPRRVLVVLNPMGGTSEPAALSTLIEHRFAAAGMAYQLYETTGDDDFPALVSEALAAGCELVVVAGGDGTVSLVAGPLVGTGVPLAILPVGAANLLARELGIPADPEAALALVTGPHQLRTLDAMDLGGRHALLQVGVGLDALMIRDTDREAKRRFGRQAYLLTLLGKLGSHRAQRFSLMVDGQQLRPLAWQVLVANAGTLGMRPLRWGPNIRPDDGTLDLCLFAGRTLANLARLIRFIVVQRRFSGTLVRYLPVRESVTIATEPPLPVQADGEIIGVTPVQVRLRAQALPVIVPPPGG
jgi:diacylglycerol kinase (ATP)